jgi:hypothetical protein
VAARLVPTFTTNRVLTPFENKKRADTNATDFREQPKLGLIGNLCCPNSPPPKVSILNKIWKLAQFAALGEYLPKTFVTKPKFFNPIETTLGFNI